MRCSTAALLLPFAMGLADAWLAQHVPVSHHTRRPSLLSMASAPADAESSAGKMLQRLTVVISDEERAEGALFPETLRSAADVLAENGVVLLKGGLSIERCESCRAAAMGALDECVAHLKEQGVDYRTSFAFREVVHRAPLRYDVSLQPGTGITTLPAEDAAALADGLWQPLVRRVLGRDARHNFDGAFIALPGAGPQEPHMDGGHLFHTTHGFSLDLPVHIVNVFIPLVDTSMAMGPTEFWPGSHIASAVPFIDEMASVALEADCGDVIIFDYRVFHRGLPNTSPTVPRPVLYQTYSRAWFRDAHNFPEQSLLAKPQFAQQVSNQGIESGLGHEQPVNDLIIEDSSSYHPQRGFAG